MLFVLMTPLILSACSGGRYDTAESIGLVLPPVIQYERGFLAKAADEVKAGHCPAHVELGKDYALTRDKIRIAQTALK